MESLPQTLPEAEAQQDTLWQKAPAWRNLTAAASLLTLAAVAVPALLPPEAPVPAPVPLAALEAVSATPSVTLSPLPPAPRARVARAVPQAEPAAPVCSIRQGPGRVMSGTVIGFIAHEQSLRIFANTGRNNGGTVSPAYLDALRVMVQPDPGTNGGSRNPVVPSGIAVSLGDHVTYVTPSIDPSRPCSFIPSHVVANQGPAPADLVAR